MKISSDAFRRINVPALLLTALIIGTIVVNAAVLLQSRYLYVYDEGAYITHAVMLHDILRSGNSLRFLTHLIRFTGNGHPQGVMLAGAVCCFFTDRIPGARLPLLCLVCSGLFWTVLLTATYRLGTVLFCCRKTGLLAAGLLAGSPVLFGFSRMFTLDVPLAATVTLAVCFLPATRNFRNGPLTVAAAGCAITAFCCKETALIFLAPVIIAYGIESLRHSSDQKRTRSGLLWYGSVTGIITGLLLWHNRNLFPFYFFASFGYIRPHDVLFYLQPGKWIFLYGGPLLSIILIMVGLIGLKRWRDVHAQPILAAWLLPPLLFYSAMNNQLPRFIIPLLPAFFLSVAGLLRSIYKQRMFTAITATVFTAACVQLLGYSFFIPEKTALAAVAARTAPGTGFYYNLLSSAGRLGMYTAPEYPLIQRLSRIFFAGADRPDEGVFFNCRDNAQRLFETAFRAECLQRRTIPRIGSAFSAYHATVVLQKQSPEATVLSEAWWSEYLQAFTQVVVFDAPAGQILPVENPVAEKAADVVRRFIESRPDEFLVLKTLVQGQFRLKIYRRNGDISSALTIRTKERPATADDGSAHGASANPAG